MMIEELYVDGLERQIAAQAVELAALQAENAKLRDALERIAAGNPAKLGEWLTDIEMADIARVALIKVGNEDE